MSDPTSQIPPHFLVVVPGITGSRLRSKKTGGMVWLDFSAIPKDPREWTTWIDVVLRDLAYPNEDLEPAGLVDKVIFMPPWAKHEGCGRLMTFLQGMGYRADPTQYAKEERTLYAFAYDWRQDIRTSAGQLAEAIQLWQGDHPGKQPWIIAQSNGDLVARWYIERLGGKQQVGRLFLLGSPGDGAPRARRAILDGVTFLRKWPGLPDVGEGTRKLIRSWPSLYQSLPPTDPLLPGPDNSISELTNNLNLLETDEERGLLRDGHQFAKDLGTATSVETLCFFGPGQLTDTEGVGRIGAGGFWNSIAEQATNAGAGTDPERAAARRTSKVELPFAVTPGETSVNPDVMQKLEWELMGKYQPGARADVIPPTLAVTFKTEEDAYAPGEPIRLTGQVQCLDSGAADPNARITVELHWRHSLPGAPVALPTVFTTSLTPSEAVPGEYSGVLTAPDAEGYYELRATVVVPRGPAVTLVELMMVERTSRGVGMWRDGEEPRREAGVSAPKWVPPAGPWDLPRHTRAMDELPKTVGSKSTSASADAQRYINAEIEDHPPSQPLRVGEQYLLAFWVDLQAALISSSLPLQGEFGPGEDVIDLTVKLTSNDFAIEPNLPLLLHVPRTGPSTNRARFTITPKQAGDGVIAAIILKNNYLVQVLTLKYSVGTTKAISVGVQTQSRPLVDRPEGERSDVFLLIEPDGQEFRVTVAGAFADKAKIHVQVQALDAMINRARAALRKVIDTSTDRGATKIYQTGIDIPDWVNQKSLNDLARVGWDLYRELFVGDGYDAQTKRVGEYLRQLAQEEELKIQIVSKEFLLPWGLLYVADEYQENKIDPEMFLGLKHIIEHIPFRSEWSPPRSAIGSKNPPLAIGVNVNRDIRSPVIDEQLAYWAKFAGQAEVETRSSKKDVVEALANARTRDQILYFFCHAGAGRIDDTAGPGAGAYLELTGKQRVTLNDLRRRASTDKPFAGNPLVFINACESADLSPLFYNSFMSYFVAKGARGMVGTECSVPTLFAAEWSRRFFDQFLAGDKSLGQIFLDLRRDFYDNNNNILGLVYALYCSKYTKIDPGLRVG